MLPNTTRRGEISSDYAIYDTQFLFNTLAAGYGLYIYFGGDDVFAPMRDKIIDTISTQQYWCTRALGQLYVYHLSQVIYDRHFRIDSTSFGDLYRFFVANTMFDISENGFVNRSNSLYIQELWLPCHPGLILDADEILRLSIDEDGHGFFFTPVIPLLTLATPADAIPKYLYIRYSDGTVEAIPLEKMKQPQPRVICPVPSLDTDRDVPVVAIESMSPTTVGGDRYILQFLQYAHQLRNEQVFILDLRKCLGGDIGIPFEWFYILKGEYIPSSYYVLRTRGIGLFPVTDFGRGERFAIFDDHHMYHANPREGLISSDQLIIVLTGPYTQSAAEFMVDMAFNLENTLIIGQNTGGAFMANMGFTLHLPRSRMPFNMGNMWNALHESHFQEGLGFAPDIWVSGDALAAALGLIENFLIFVIS